MEHGTPAMVVAFRPQEEVNSSFEALLDRLQPKLRSVLARFRIPLEDAEDLLQQSYLAYLYKQDTVRDPEAWLVGTLRNRCLMYWRGRRRRLYEAVDTAILESLAEPRRPTQEVQDLCRDVEGLISQLPDRCRSVLDLRYRLGLEPSETADRLGYQSSSIYKITGRCLAALTRLMISTGLVNEDSKDA